MERAKILGVMWRAKHIAEERRPRAHTSRRRHMSAEAPVAEPVGLELEGVLKEVVSSEPKDGADAVGKRPPRGKVAGKVRTAAPSAPPRQLPRGCRPSGIARRQDSPSALSLGRADQGVFT